MSWQGKTERTRRRVLFRAMLWCKRWPLVPAGFTQMWSTAPGLSLELCSEHRRAISGSRFPLKGWNGVPILAGIVKKPSGSGCGADSAVPAGLTDGLCPSAKAGKPAFLSGGKPEAVCACKQRRNPDFGQQGVPVILSQSLPEWGFPAPRGILAAVLPQAHTVDTGEHIFL